jgi:tRNA(Arg) A34 adenosine deaminase TadA
VLAAALQLSIIRCRSQPALHAVVCRHGEVGAIRDASQRLGTPHLRGCVLYTSSEPCPMCMGACYWARIDKIFYATTAKDVKVSWQ